MNVKHFQVHRNKSLMEVPRNNISGDIKASYRSYSLVEMRRMYNYSTLFLCFACQLPDINDIE